MLSADGTGRSNMDRLVGILWICFAAFGVVLSVVVALAIVLSLVACVSDLFGWED